MQKGSRIVPSLLLLIFVPGAIVGSYWYFGTAAQRQIRHLEQRLEDQRAAYETEIARLIGEERRAQFRVVSQEERDGEVWNRIRFVEFLADDDEKPSFEQVFELPGREVFIDAVTVKFQPEEVQAGRARNFSVFRRAFSNRVKPDDGIALYDVTLTRVGKMARDSIELEQPSEAELLLAELRRYIEDPAAARGDGVRTIEGEAKYTNPRPGHYYELIQQANGSLTIEEKAIPAVLRE